MPSVKVEPAVNPKISGLCTRPYPNHPKWCPNFNKKEGYPPGVPLISDTFDLRKDVYAIYNIFDFAEHTSRMRKKHPEWTRRQVECCLYWQPRARKALKDEIAAFLNDHTGMTISRCPEAQGVDLTATMASVGIRLEWPPKNVTYQIVLAGELR